MLTVHYGPFHPELENAFIGRLKERAGPGPLAVVTPSRRLAERLQRLAAVEHGLSLLDVHFHTFYSLAQSIAEESLGQRRIVSDPVFHDRLVDELLLRQPRLGGVFGGEARPRALAASLRSSLRDLIDAGVSAGTLAEHFGEELLHDSQSRKSLEALLGLTEAYEARLEELGILSPSGLTRLATAKAAQSPLLGSLREMLYYGFYDLTGLQLEFFEAVVERCPTRLYFPYRRKHPAFRFAEDFFEQKLLGHAVEELSGGGPAPALAGALNRLFAPDSGSAPPTPALRVINASGARDEAWAVAKEVLRLVEEKGAAYEDIAVAARTLEPYRNALAEVFTENAIPFDMVCGEPLLRHPLAKCALNLLTLRQRDFPAVTVEDIFSSPYYNRIHEGPNPVYHWRLAIAKLGIFAGWLQWRGKLEGRVGADLELRPERVLEGEEGYAIPKEDLKRLWTFVKGLETALADETEKTWASKARSARALLGQYLRLPEDADAREREVWQAVQEALDSFSVFDLLGTPCDWPAFLEAFEDKLCRATLDSATGKRGLRVLSAMDARGESFRHLFLIGLKEKLFPRHVLEDPLLRDPIRAALRHPAGYWISQKSAGHEEERLLFYLLAGSARETLTCVYPRSDEAGKASVPSLYLRELCRAAGRSLNDAIFNRHVPRQPAGKLEALDPALASPKEVCLRSALEGRPAGEYLDLVGGDGALLDACLKRQGALNAWGPAGSLDGLIGEPSDFLSRLRRHGLSPSALDSLAQCPFRFFADRVLGLGDSEQPSDKGEFASWIRGKIYHGALERFYGKLNELDWPLDHAEPLRSAIESVFRDYGWQTMGVYPLLWLSAKETMTEELERFVDWDLAQIKATGLRPAWLEKRLRGPLPGVLPLTLEGLVARGVIDRVDCDEKGKRFRIVDYKTRWRQKAKLSDLALKGELHQLPLYARLAGLALGSDWILEGAHLFVLEDSPQRTGLSRSRDYAGAQLEQDSATFYENVAKAVTRIAQGRFPINPDDNEFGHCSYCDYAALCRKAHGPSRQRAQAALSDDAGGR